MEFHGIPTVGPALLKERPLLHHELPRQCGSSQDGRKTAGRDLPILRETSMRGAGGQPSPYHRGL